jgi:O-succinylbenzoate synthase
MREHITTPIALDESLTSFSRAMDVLDILGCEAIVLKPGLLGGYLSAKALHDECVQRQVHTALGGMIETGVARAANLALAGLPGFRDVPVEIVPDGRWFHQSVLKQEVNMENGRIRIPKGPGLGVDVDLQVVNRLTRRMHVTRARNR